jgi:hypothetical protein
MKALRAVARPPRAVPRSGATIETRLGARRRTPEAAATEHRRSDDEELTMFGLFEKRRRTDPGWSCLMGWRVLTYQEAGRWLSLQIEPMKDAPCRVYVPSAPMWRAQAPAWASERRETLLGRMREVAWNRELEWLDHDRARFWHRHVDDPVDGSLESTPGGRQLEQMRLFHPDRPARFSARDSKRAWCAACEQMCLQVQGRVEIDESEVIPGSVFQEIELATLRRNPNVSLRFADAG